MLDEVESIASGAAGQFQRSSGSEQSHRIDQNGRRTCRPRLTRPVALVPTIHAQYNTRVSVSGALRYAWNALRGGPSMLKVGDPAPDFETTDHRGRRVKLKDFRGKKVLLWFFPKASTPG